jgi:hypothetical protein
VDGVLLFLIGSLREARKLKDILDMLSTATGMELKVHKSFVSFNDLEEV